MIVHPSNPTRHLSLLDLTLIYKISRTRWEDGTGISLYLPARGSSASVALATRVMSLQNEVAVSRYYLRAIFQQRISNQPVRCTSTDDAARRIEADRSGIAIVERSELDDDARVRVIAVEGL